MSKDERDLKALRDQQELEILRRVLFWLGAAVLLEALVLLANRFTFHQINTMLTMVQILEVLQYVGILLGLGFLAWAIAGRKKNPNRGVGRIISAAFFASISVCAFLFLHLGMSCVSILLVGIPAMAGLIMIYYLYQREFFVLAAISGLGMLGLWVFRSTSATYVMFYYVYSIVVLCLTVAVFVLSRRVQKEDGVLIWGKHKLEIVQPDASYKTVWTSCALVMAFLLASPFLGTVFAYYAFLALVVWIFVMAVYFTSRLM